MKRIESRDNKIYRQLAELRQTRHSREHGLVFLEGLRLCEDALLSGAVAEYALVAQSALDIPAVAELLNRLSEDVLQICLADHLFNSLCDTKKPQGFALVCRSNLLDRPVGPPRENGLYLVAEEIQDPGNLGTMIRTADAFAFDAVIMTSGTVYPYNEKVMRAAMGSCFHINLLTLPDIESIAKWLSSTKAPIPLLAADPAGLDTGRLSGWPVPAALVIGNEARGLSAGARALCSRLVRIPMPGRAESLNAAVASAILCYELMQARDRQK